jgi:hypothetical protein
MTRFDMCCHSLLGAGCAWFFNSARESTVLLAVYVSLFVSAIAEQLSSSMHGRLLLRGFA